MSDADVLTRAGPRGIDPTGAPETDPPPAETAEAPTRRPGGRAVLVDVLGLGLLSCIALSGFGPAFGGLRYLWVGLFGLVVGTVLTVAGARLRVPTLLVVLAAFVVLVVVGPWLTDPTSAFAPALPTLSTARHVVDTAISGWADLLTTTVPVGAAQRLLILPWLCGLICGVGCMTISRRSRGSWSLLALVLPLAVLVAAIVVGVDHPAWRLQASAFVAVAVLWGGDRQRTARSGAMPIARRGRWLAACGVLLVVGFVGLTLGESSVVRGGRARTVYRDHVDPPLDLRDEPSPLEGFRRFRTGDLADVDLFSVRGLEEGDRVRLATLDSYDGVVWHVRPDDRSEASSSVFQRAGSELPVPDEGEDREVVVTVQGYSGPWMPMVGAPHRVEFGGGRALDLSEEFRVNLATRSGAVPEGLRRGDRYTLDAVVPDEHADLVEGVADPLAPEPITVRVPMVSEQAAVFVRELDADASPLEQVRAIAARLRGEGTVPNDKRRGFFSDGLIDDGQAPSRPGHSAERLRTLLDPESLYIVGNEEQYAAAMALMAIDRGLPARVVVGFAPEVGTGGEDSETVVTGEDVTAWAEVAVDGVGWIPIDATPTETEVPAEAPDIIPPPDRLVPPPVVTTLTVPQPVRNRRGEGESPRSDRDESGFAGLPTWAKVAGGIALPPLLLIGGGTAAMAALKARRRRTRRTRGSPAEQVAAGWEDVCDVARDMGDVVPQRATRREAAVLITSAPGSPGSTPEPDVRTALPDLAGRADALAFGPDPVDATTAAAYWREVDTARQSMLRSLTPFDRWKVLVNPSSLRRPRDATPAPRREPAEVT